MLRSENNLRVIHIFLALSFKLVLYETRCDSLGKRKKKEPLIKIRAAASYLHVFPTEQV